MTEQKEIKTVFAVVTTVTWQADAGHQVYVSVAISDFITSTAYVS